MDMLSRKTTSRIISGEDASVGQFPWQTSVRFTTSQGSFFCGGALISEQWILTAAHCADGAISFTIQLGGLTLGSTEGGRVEVTTSTAIVHEGYNSNLNHDVALIKLRDPIAFTDRIKAIPLPKRGDRVGDAVPLTVSGWGLTNEGTSLADTLQFVNLNTISNPQCASEYGNDIIIDSTLCCIGNPEHSTCSGDSGGPLIQYTNLGGAQHVGVVSFVSSRGCDVGKPSGFVRTESHLDWIHQHTGIAIE